MDTKTELEDFCPSTPDRPKTVILNAVKDLVVMKIAQQEILRFAQNDWRDDLGYFQTA